MQKALFLYSSQDGQTIKILKHIERALSATHQCDIRNLHQSLDIDVNAYDQVLIGGAVRYGHLHTKLYEFIEKHHVALTNRQAGFFCVNLTARKAGKDTPEGSVYIRKFLKRSKWQPQMLAVFAGALCYPKYVWYLIMAQIERWRQA